MAVKVGINGFGRIGRLVFRTIKERVADKIRGRCGQRSCSTPRRTRICSSTIRPTARINGTVEAKDGNLVVDGKTIKVIAEKDLNAIKWADMGVDIVIESTGLFTDATQIARTHHLRRREKSHHHRACEERRHYHRAGRERRQVRSRQASR